MYSHGLVGRVPHTGVGNIPEGPCSRRGLQIGRVSADVGGGSCPLSSFGGDEAGTEIGR